MSKRWFFIIDNAAMLMFATVTGFIIETQIAGMSVDQSIAARIAAIPLNLATGRPYAVYRDWVLARLTLHTPFEIFVAESLVFTFFQIPLYLVVLTLAGVDSEKMLAASLSKIVLLGGLGRGYGIFLDYFRSLFTPKPSS